MTPPAGLADGATAAPSAPRSDCVHTGSATSVPVTVDVVGLMIRNPPVFSVTSTRPSGRGVSDVGCERPPTTGTSAKRDGSVAADAGAAPPATVEPTISAPSATKESRREVGMPATLNGRANLLGRAAVALPGDEAGEHEAATVIEKVAKRAARKERRTTVATIRRGESA